MPSYALHPQSLLMETSWVCSWFERVLRLADRVKPTRKQVFIADRSPFSAVLYSANGRLLEPVIRAQMKEVQDFAHVQFYTVHVQVERELLWRRICARIALEPERLRLNEHKREWMDETLDFYESFAWDFTVANDERSVAVIAAAISRLLVEKDDTFEAVHKCTKPRAASSHSTSNSSLLGTDSECESAEEETLDAEWNSRGADMRVRSIIAFNNTPPTDGL
uniref:NadR/Ttd14 AAA domain-containing protein n=1 Tax=Hyaloperonospora arabidopsidis (strain Emoy2) TaxID=559515 RepID=M4B6D2_HYAAE